MKTCAENQPCPCGRTGQQARALAFSKCCGQWLGGAAAAPDAHALMRSRYSAFVLERDVYLLQTWHASARPASIEFDADVRWLGLEVRHFSPPSPMEPNHAQVEFVARQRPPGGRAVRLHENSDFVLEDGRWFYLSGAMQDA
jgi:SEC-C motif-containing protein